MGLGCMRLTTPHGGEERVSHVIRAALAAGITIFDTARAYGDNERLVGRALGDRARVVTKCGMSRPDGRWVPDGRARAVRADAEASRAALGRAPDLLLLHAPDPRTPLATSVRALAEIRDAGGARGI